MIAKGALTTLILPVLTLFIINCGKLGADKYDEEHYAVIYASKCEVCKYVIEEFELLLKETGKTRKVIETGYGLEGKKKRTKYVDSELRFDEVLLDLCDRMNNFRIHKERKDSTRFDKKMSQTFETLHGLVDKGVKVDLGIPHDLWDKPSAEISDLQKKCDTLIGDHEDRLKSWYFNKDKEQDTPLKDYFCKNYYLSKKEDKNCLYEVFDPVKSVKTAEEQKKEKEEAEARKAKAEKKKMKTAKGDPGRARKKEL